MSDAALMFNSVVRKYEQGGRVLSVLDNLNLEVKRGEVVALVGPSGSGKSTLLQIAGLLDNPDAGQVWISGENMTGAGDDKRTMARRRHIGFIYQFHHLLPEFSAVENVALPQMIAGVSQKMAQEKGAELLGSLGLRERLHHRPAALSGGEQQRVAIARALANEPALLLADEPTGNLDVTTSQTVFDMLMQVSREKNAGMLVATHNLVLAGRMDRIVRL